MLFADVCIRLWAWKAKPIDKTYPAETGLPGFLLSTTGGRRLAGDKENGMMKSILDWTLLPGESCQDTDGTIWEVTEKGLSSKGLPFFRMIQREKGLELEQTYFPQAGRK